MRRRDWLKSGFAFATTGVLPMPGRPDEIPANPVTQSLYGLFASEWDYQMGCNPTWASTLGDRRWNDRWPDVSLEAIVRDHQHSLEVLQKLEAIDRGAL